MSTHRAKADLPAKPCAQCARLFTWRKKWSRDWEAVKYCSQRCRKASARPASKQRPNP